jgi:hypothetical protein
MSLHGEAYALGNAAGNCAGSWAVDGNTSQDTLRAIIKGYNDGDPAVLNMQPVSVVWSSPTRDDVLQDIMDAEDVDEIDDHITDELLCEYENAFSEGFWDQVIRSATAMLTD